MRNTDDRLVTEVKAVFDEVDRALAAQPDQIPPWENIQAFVKRSRDRRRRRVALVVGAAAMAVVSLFVLQGKLFQASNQGQPQPAAPSFREWDKTQGSLRDDGKWLSDLREFAAYSDVASPDVTGEPLETPGKNVKVLFASDIGEYRVAVVTADWESNDDTQMAEFVGRRGAAVEDLVPGEGGGSIDDMSSLQQGLLYPEMLPEGSGVDPNSAAVYVLATGDVPTVQVQQPPTIDAQGKVTQHTSLLEFDGGAASAAFDQPGHYAVVIPSIMKSGSESALSDGYQDFTIVDTDVVDHPKVNVEPIRGSQSRVAEIVNTMAMYTWYAVRQPLEQGEWQLLRAEPGGLTATGPNRVVVGVLTLPSGARVVAAGQVEADTSDDGSAGLSWLDTARIRPAGDLDDVSIAWRLKEGETKAKRTAAVGPAGTESVEWSTKSGGTIEGQAVDTLATIDRTDITSVRFLDGQGQELGSQKVLAPAEEPDKEFGEQTMESPDLLGYWQLPEIEDGLAGF